MLGRFASSLALVVLTASLSWPNSLEQDIDPDVHPEGMEHLHQEPEWNQFRAQQRAILQMMEAPAGPPEDYQGNPVDWFLQQWYQEKDAEVPEPAKAHVWVRRAYLDATGLLPPFDEVRGFAADASPDKYEKLVEALLGDRQAYAEHWITFWSDLLRNDEQTNIDNLRGSITQWLYDSLLANKPYDRFVVELLNPDPKGGPGGFLKGINWRGRINASQRPVIQTAQVVGQVFMGTMMKCSSCHDNFTKTWSLRDTYGLAACFSIEPGLELFRCDKPLGEVQTARFPFEGLGEIDPEANLYERRLQAAKMVVSPRNPRFARTIVNRLFDRLMGRGLFEPIDDLDYEPIYGGLLDWLAYDFMKHDFDLKHTITRIMTSQAYQRKSLRIRTEFTLEPTYAAPRVRRMPSEAFLDGIAQVSGHWQKGRLNSAQVSSDQPRAWRKKKPARYEVALGRPNREQVVSQREDEASVLQMLELVNGDGFSAFLEEASSSLAQRFPHGQEDYSRLIERVYHRGLSRSPAPEEYEALRPLFAQSSASAEAHHEAVEDLLWIVCMKPEFQFIH